MSRALVVVALVLSGAAFVSGCQVDASVLATGRFPCATDSDCGPGWGCFRASPLTEDFCAPLCGGEPCDGVCTGSPQPMCLEGCRIRGGEGDGCAGEDFECLRVSAESDDGVCFPKAACETTADCAPGEVCLGELLASANPMTTLDFDRLYCTPIATSELACPAGFEELDVPLPEGAAALCRIGCSITDPMCPLGFGCLGLLQRVAPLVRGVDGPVCDLGTFGLGCQDDTNCFVGRCLDTGTAQGKVCTVTCDDASALAGGCGGLIADRLLLSFFATMECDEGAASEDGSGLCAPRYSLSFPGCTAEEGSAYPCESDLRCRSFDSTSEAPVSFCTKTCATAAECRDPGGLSRADVSCQAGFCLWGLE